jgi:rhamnosyltransferase
VIIPTLNGGLDFVRCLEGIRAQAGVGEVELIVVDSGSEDGTAARAADAGARVVPIEKNAFNHGAVRDLGARQAQGAYLVFTVQDARPADAHWLRGLVEPLHRGAAAATSRILPRPDSGPLARRTVLDSPMASDTPWVQDPGRSNPGSMSPEALRAYLRFDDISSAIRADVYGRVPFRPVAMSEDIQWALDAQSRGYKIVFAPESVVYHSHEYSPRQAYRRYFEDAVALREILGLRVRPTLVRALKGYAFEVLRDLSFLLAASPWALMRYAAPSLVLRAYQVAGQWRGSR